MMNIAQVSDFAIDLHGTIAILWPQTDAGREWVAENIDEDAQRWGKDGIVIEHRYIGDIVNGIHDADMNIKDVIDMRKKA
jgi:hypothetical protein